MSSRLAGKKRSPWPRRIAFWLAASAAVAGAAWLHPTSRARLAAITDRLVTGLALVEPSLAADYFLLQATLCPWRYGFSCAPDNQPANLKVVPGRRTIDPRNPASRTQARAQVDAEFKQSASWSSVAMATPGAAAHTLRYVAGYGWGAWVSAAVAFLVAAALVFSLLDATFAAGLVALAGAAGTAWILAAAMRLLAPVGWVPQFVVLVSAAGLSLMQLRDLYLVSALHDRVTFRRRRRQFEQAE